MVIVLVVGAVHRGDIVRSDVLIHLLVQLISQSKICHLRLKQTTEGDFEDTIYNAENDVFYVDDSGDDCWYPSGGVGITEELFTETNRMMDKRPVWIFKGDSGLGKSYIAGIIANSDRAKTVYETDTHEELDTIEADIIVVGNKYDHSLEEIESKIKGEHEIIYVDFSKSL